MYTKWSGILLGLIVGAAIAVRCYGIADRTFWFDEAFSHRLISDFSWAEMIERTGRDVHPPLFYVALRLWACLFGDGIVTLRLFSVFMAALTIIGVYQLVFDSSRCGSDGLDPRRSSAAGLSAAALVASTPLHIYWSQEARMYTLGTALVVWSSWFLLRALQRDDRRWYALYVLTAAALMYTHNYGLFTVLGQSVFVAAYFVYQGPQALASWRFGKATAALAAAGAAYLPWLPVVVAQKQRVSAEYWIDQLNWWTLPDACQELLFPVNAATVPDHLLSLPCAAVAVVTVVCLARRPTMGSGLLVALVVVPVLASVGVSLASVPIVHSRYYQFAYVAAVCGFAILLFRSVPRRGATLVAAALVVSALAYTHYFYRHELKVHARPGIKGAVQYLRQNMREGDVIVVTHPCIYYSVRRYLRGQATPRLFLDGDIPSHYMGAPILTAADLIGSDELESLKATTLWVVTTTGYGQNWRMQRLPAQWRQDYGTLREFREVSFFQGSVHVYQCRKSEDIRAVQDAQATGGRPRARRSPPSGPQCSCWMFNTLFARCRSVPGHIVVAFYSILLCTATFAFKGSEVARDREDPAHDAERQLMLHRSSIRSGVVKVHSHYTRQGKTKEIDYTLMFDGKTTRITKTEPYQGAWMPGQMYSTTYVFTDDERVLRYCDKQSADGSDIVASIRPRTEDMLLNYVDPRLIEIVPSSFAGLPHYNMNTIFGTVDWQIKSTEFTYLPQTHSIAKLGSYIVSRPKQLADGTGCLTLTRVVRGIENRMFVDPERDFIVRRIEEKRAGELLSELDITYSDDSHFGSLLTGWSRRQFDGNGRLLSSLEIAIARQEFNLTVSSDAFQIEFPLLTLVTVRGPRNEEPERFLVLKNGTHRPVTPDEWRRAEATPSFWP